MSVTTNYNYYDTVPVRKANLNTNNLYNTHVIFNVDKSRVSLDIKIVNTRL